MIKLLSVAIVAGLFFPESNQLAIEAAEVQSGIPSNVLLQNQCWTDWFNRDNPSGSGDWETLKELRTENPGKICSAPTGIEATTLSGLSVSAAGEVIYRNDVTDGFVCRKQDQSDRTCNDYRVRFSCPPSFCGQQECWTDWFDRDDASGTGDWETLKELRRENPGKICPAPTGIVATTLSGLSVSAAGEVIYRNDVTDGFVCRKQDQPDRTCHDYRVRFSCPPSFCGQQDRVCWTKWYNRDNPSGTGDWETWSNLRNENPGQICDQPLHIEAITTGINPVPATSTGQTFYAYNPAVGIVCRNADQSSGYCYDYQVRFGCPCVIYH